MPILTGWRLRLFKVKHWLGIHIWHHYRKAVLTKAVNEAAEKALKPKKMNKRAWEYFLESKKFKKTGFKMDVWPVWRELPESLRPLAYDIYMASMAVRRRYVKLKQDAVFSDMRYHLHDRCNIYKGSRIFRAFMWDVDEATSAVKTLLAMGWKPPKRKRKI